MTKESPKTKPTRPYTPADHEAASALIGDVRPLGMAGCHAHLSGGEGAVDGVALWLEPPPGSEEAYLGPVVAPGIRLGLRYYELVLACANDALDRGYRRGYFTIKGRGALRDLTDAFRVEPVATGWETEGDRAREWEVHVDLPDAIEQLRNIIRLLDGRSA